MWIGWCRHRQCRSFLFLANLSITYDIVYLVVFVDGLSDLELMADIHWWVVENIISFANTMNLNLTTNMGIFKLLIRLELNDWNVRSVWRVD